MASSSVASIIAKDAPTQTRGPPPKGEYAKRGILPDRTGSSLQRSGSNRSGSGKKRGSRCVRHCKMKTFDPAGTRYQTFSFCNGGRNAIRAFSPTRTDSTPSAGGTTQSGREESHVSHILPSAGGRVFVLARPS